MIGKSRIKEKFVIIWMRNGTNYEHKDDCNSIKLIQGRSKMLYLMVF